MRDPNTGRFCKAQKFKVGDRVVLAVNWAGCADGKGSSGTVTEWGNAAGFVTFDTYQWSGLSMLHCWQEWLLPEPTPSPKFIAGDVVTIKGWLGVWRVDECEANRYRCVIISGHTEGFHWAKPEDMKKVPMVQFKDGSKVEEAALKVIEDACKPRIAPGSVVRLRSGGPEMTATIVNHNGVVCRFFESNACSVLQVAVECLEFVR